MSTMSKPVDPRNFFHDGDDEPPQNVVPIKPPPREPPPTVGDNPPPLLHSDHMLPKAEAAARQLIRSWCDHGPKQVNHCDPECFPGVFQDIAAGVLDSMLNHGAKDFGGVHAYFTGAPAGLMAELVESNQGNSPQPQDCGPLIKILLDHHRARRREMVASKIAKALERGKSVEPLLKELQEIEDGGKDASLLVRAYAEQYDPNAKPPPDEAVMAINQAPIAARGNLTVIQGKQKAGKSAVVSSIIAAALRGKFTAKGDTLGVEWVDDKHDGVVIHFDTEQSKSDWWGLVTRSFIRSGNRQFMSRIVSISLMPFKLADRMQIVEEVLRDQAGKNGVELLVLDGVADLTASPNDEEESRELVARLMALANKYHIAIVCIIHENPSAENGKTRGHLGSELGRKAFANLRVDKDKDSVSTLYGTDMRKKDIPKSAGICFAWNEEEKMHTVIGSSSDIERERAAKSAETKKANETAKHTALLESILGNDSMPYNDLVQAIIEADGVSDSAAKKRIPKWIASGLLAKNSDGNYSLP